jgi:hypothetical protein
MPLIKPTFTIPDNIPLLSGPWGPFINTNLTSGQYTGLRNLIIVSIALILAAGAAAYMYQKSDKVVECKTESLSEDKKTVDYFLMSNVDIAGFFLGMGAGIIFGFIDNAGLFYGMSYLDPIFDPNKLPWVYGKGGKRVFTGLDQGELIYKNTEFSDGKLTPTETTKFKKIAEGLSKKYDREYKLSEDKRDVIHVNETAYSDPNSGMFLGSGIKKKEFVQKFIKRELREKTYYKEIENYRDFKNNKPRYKQLKEKSTKISKELHKLKGLGLGIGSSLGTKKRIRQLEKEYFNIKPWPGKDKSLADASLQGWTPGKLTQAGLGNTYSDTLGGFVSTFVALIIVSASGQCTSSLIAEVLGLFIGCLMGVYAGRSSWTPGSLS